ncbi:MAG: thiamine ABC transporter substrate-binding protein [Bdellovibrionales bacterium]|nr:thiamine ABC transporter substrate-binding protein [Bdellovibrionales bacterium]
MYRLWIWVPLGMSLVGCDGKNAESPRIPAPELRVATYDTLAAPGGWLQALAQEFEKSCGCSLKLLPSGDAGQMTARAELEASSRGPSAHVFVGFDQNLWPRLRHLMDAELPKLAGEGDLVPGLRIESGFVPFDYGPLTLMADTVALERLKLAPPRKLSDLLKPEYRKKFVLQDPRTSSPGLVLALHTWTTAGGDAGFSKLWRGLAASWLALPSGWDEAYGLFLDGRAPLVWSYVTSQAYHAAQGDSSGRYRALELEDGHPVQVEGAARLAGLTGVERERAGEFLEFLISRRAQELLPTLNWMLPAREGLKLPPAFEGLPKLATRPPATLDPSHILSRWTSAVRKAGSGRDR